MRGWCFWLSFAFAIIVTAAQAQLLLYHVGGSAVGGAYSGPGDLDPNWVAWWGLRAYNAAARGTKAINVCNASDVACADMSTSASTGKLVITTIGGTDCTASETTCTIKTAYDQTGNGNDVTNATIANRPTFSATAVNSLPCMKLVSGNSQELTKATISSSITNATYSSVAERTANFTAFSVIMHFGSGTPTAMDFSNAANTVLITLGTTQTVGSVNDSVAHRLNASFTPNTSSTFFIDGVSNNTGNAGGNGTAGPVFLGSTNASTQFLSGYICEAAFNSTTASGTLLGNIDTNQHNFWGI